MAPNIRLSAPASAPLPLLDHATDRIRGPIPLLLLLVGMTALLRLPALVSTGPLGYDDGVYGASIQAMRHGALPFRDVFSSQGPLFLPLLWLFDAVGLHASFWAPRLIGIAASTALVLITFALARAVTDRSGSLAAATLVAFSPLVLEISGPISSDGVALAFASASVAVATYLPRHGRARAIVPVGLLAGCALAVKGPLVAGPLLAALWLTATRRGPRAAVGAGVVALVVPVALGVPWGLDNVWHQFIVLHLHAESFDPLKNAAKLVWKMVSVEAPIALFFFWAFRQHSERGRGSLFGELRAWRSSEAGEVKAAAAIWLAFELPLLLLHSPFFARFATYLLVPMALFCGVGISRWRRPRKIGARVVAFAGIWLVFASWPSLWPTHPENAEQQAVEALRADLPAAARIVTDEQGLAWRAGRLTPDNLVDTSNTRIKAGFLTLSDVVDAARARQVCAVLPWSGRFASLVDPTARSDSSWLPTLVAELPDYSVAANYGNGHVLLIRRWCQPS